MLLIANTIVTAAEVLHGIKLLSYPKMAAVSLVTEHYYNKKKNLNYNAIIIVL